MMLAYRREVFGRKLNRQPLAIATLQWMDLHSNVCVHFLYDVLHLLAQTERDEQAMSHNITQDKQGTTTAQLLRFLTPIIKLFTAKECMAVMSEGVEFFGGQGYIEETVLTDATSLSRCKAKEQPLNELKRVLFVSSYACRESQAC